RRPHRRADGRLGTPPGGDGPDRDPQRDLHHGRRARVHRVRHPRPPRPGGCVGRGSTMTGIVPGAELGPVSVTVTRADLVRYAGASGDFNPIHWSDRVATLVGLPGVVAHGMYTMALAGQVVTGWLGGGQRIES